MVIKIDPPRLKQTTWPEYLLRFVGGGLMTVLADLIAKGWGPVVGGLFLAFPAIFPASVTLIAKHERLRKSRKGLQGRLRGIYAAAADAAGGAMGSVGLAAFAAVCWGLLTRYPAPWILPLATLAWTLVSVSIWFIRRHRHRASMRTVAR